MISDWKWTVISLSLSLCERSNFCQVMSVSVPQCSDHNEFFFTELCSGNPIAEKKDQQNRKQTISSECSVKDISREYMTGIVLRLTAFHWRSPEAATTWDVLISVQCKGLQMK